VLYVGNQSGYKNVDTLLAAAESLSQRLPDLKVFLTWPVDCRVQRRSRNAVCLGYLEGGALTEAYRLADLFVMPSLVETVGLPLLEAMNAGVPIVAADRPYAHEICDDAAVFFDPFDVKALETSIEALLGDNVMRAEFAKRGRALACQRRAMRPYGRMLDAAVRAAASN
jgi:glycosyltransferase involved in cell wall biosynthesis